MKLGTEADFSPPVEAGRMRRTSISFRWDNSRVSLYRCSSSQCSGFVFDAKWGPLKDPILKRRGLLCPPSLGCVSRWTYYDCTIRITASTANFLSYPELQKCQKIQVDQASQSKP